MYIKKDYTYINTTSKLLLEKGFAKLSIHSVHFDRHYTEEQKKQNVALANSMTREQWGAHCDEVAKSFVKPLTEILQQFVEKFNIHQVSEETSTMEHYRSDWDLFFWSDKGWNEKDYMTHFSLSFNESRDVGRNMKLLDEVTSLVKSMSYDNIGCRIQYQAVVNETMVEEEALELVGSLAGKFVDYYGMTGKIKFLDIEDGVQKYGFFKKNARANYYPVSDADIVALFSTKGGKADENK